MYWRERDRERGRDRERHTEKEGEGDTERYTERERDREKEGKATVCELAFPWVERACVGEGESACVYAFFTCVTECRTTKDA